MFAYLGRVATSYKWIVTVFWLLLAAVLFLLAPNINDVAVNDQRAFLADDSPSLAAAQEVGDYFPDEISPSNVVLVLEAEEGARVDEGEAARFQEELTSWLRSDEAPDVTDRVTSPAGADPGTVQALTSENGQVGLMVVKFSTVGTEEVTQQAMEEIGQRLQDAPEELTTYMTGDAAIIAAYDEATRQSIESTTWITILLVVFILLLVYRSPVSPLIPLSTIALAYLVSRSVVAFLGDGVMLISGYTNIFLVVILFGAGTDYCLFLISRFREEVAVHPSPADASTHTVRTVGETIASSAGTVVVGLSTMALAELGIFNTTGPSVAIGVVITLAAGLTLVPALLAIMGEHSFWPRSTRRSGEGRFWEAWADAVVRRPWAALIVTVAVLSPFAVFGQGQARDFDLLGDLPPDMEAHEGFEVLSDHLGPGAMAPLTVLTKSEHPLDSAAGLRHQQDREQRILALDHVASVRSFPNSLTEDTLSVPAQLEEQVQALDQMIGQVETIADNPETAEGASLQEAGEGLRTTGSYLQQLGREYPEIRESEGYAQTAKALQSLTVFAAEYGEGSTGQPEGDTLRELTVLLGKLRAGLQGLKAEMSGTARPIMLPAMYLDSNEELAEFRDSYISSDGTAARMRVVLDVGPYSTEALDTAEQIRTILEEGSGSGVLEGSSALILDLRDASDRDMTRTIIFVLLGILVVLLLLLRSLVAPIYLILTILLSYGATMGIVKLVFSTLLGVPGITWWVPIFMFVMLVALGMDYNIFLMGRVKEEVGRDGNRAGIRTAVARTGGIITSAGIIMAGTFAAMMSASILGLVQIGFAVAVGVLIDTFIVRTALVPAIAVLLGDKGWWPRRVDGRSHEV